MRDRHARAYAALLDGADEGMRGPDVSAWQTRLDAEHDNLRAALRHAVAVGDAETALRLTVAGVHYWATRGYVAAGRALAEAVLRLPAGPAALRMHAVNGAGVLAAEQGDFTAAREHFEAALALARTLGARDRIAGTVTNLANLALYAGDHETAVRRYEEATVIARELGDERALSLAIQNLGIAHEGAGQRARAIAALRRASRSPNARPTRAISPPRSARSPACCSRTTARARSRSCTRASSARSTCRTATRSLSASDRCRGRLRPRPARRRRGAARRIRRGPPARRSGVVRARRGAPAGPGCAGRGRRPHLGSGRRSCAANASRGVTPAGAQRAGAVVAELGDFAGARDLLEESLELARELDDGYRAARVGSNLGTLALYAADFDEAIERYGEAVAYMRALKDPRALSLVVQNLGIAHHGAGHHRQAIELLTESLDLARISQDPAHTSSVLRTLGRFLLDDDETDVEAPVALLHEAMELSYEVAERPGLTETFETLAAVAARRDDPHTGALLIGAAYALREAAGGIRQPDEEDFMQDVEARLREALGEAAFKAAAAEGGALELADAVARALELSALECRYPRVLAPWAITRQLRRARRASLSRHADVRPHARFLMVRERAEQRVGTDREVERQRVALARCQRQRAEDRRRAADAQIVIVFADVGGHEVDPAGGQDAIGRADGPLLTVDEVDAGA